MKEVKIGKYFLKHIPFHHWAIKIGDWWHELPGLGAKDSGTMNCIRKHQDDSKYTKIIDCGYTNLSDEEIEKHMATWVKEHPKYAVTQDNCQLFVRDILYALTGKSITTQNNHLGNAAIGVGVVAAVTAVCTIAAGIFVRNH